jgi:hypothetical protein
MDLRDIPYQSSGKPWSERDLFDLLSAIDDGDTLKEAAECLSRSIDEVELKVRELGVLQTLH